MGQRRTFATAAIAACATLALFAVWITWGFGGNRVTTTFDDLVQLLAAVAAALACALAARRSVGRSRHGWALLATAAGCWGVSQAIWSYVEVIEQRAGPASSLADAGYLLWGPLAVFAVVTFSTRPGGVRLRVRAVLDALIIAASLFAVSCLILMRSVVEWSTGGPMLQSVAIAYPMEDVVVFATLVFVLGLPRKTGFAPLALLAGGVTSIVVADSVFLYDTLRGSYATGNLSDAGWVAGFLLVMLAALRPEPLAPRPEVVGPQSRGRAALPYLAALAAVMAGGIQEIRVGFLEPIAYWNVAMVVALVLGRQVLALSERIALEEQLVDQALHDPLTCLANRRLFRDRVEQALARATRTGKPVTLALLGLDDFKTVNEVLGDDAGDELLVCVAERLRGCVRAGDTVARVGGDEFAVLMEDSDDPTDPLRIVERSLAALGQTKVLRGKEVTPAASVGIAAARSPDEDVEALLANADLAMHAAKAEGKGHVRVFEPRMLAQVRERASMHGDLQRAIEQGQFVLYFQPIVRAVDGSVDGAEALIRWPHSRRGLLSPGEFIPFAEESGLVIPIGRWVIEEALSEARRWGAWLPEGVAVPWVSVNVSPRQLLCSRIVEDIDRALERTGVSPDRLVVEITESTLIDNVDAATSRLAELRAHGVRISIDDFGTGYSSIGYLQHLPTDYLKIDRGFVAGLGVHDTDKALVEMIVGVGHALGLGTIAEGVESEAQRAVLQELGCDRLQGYLIARPQPADDFVHWLGRRPAGEMRTKAPVPMSLGPGRSNLRRRPDP